MTLDLESIGLRQVRCNTNTNAVGEEVTVVLLWR